MWIQEIQLGMKLLHSRDASAYAQSTITSATIAKGSRVAMTVSTREFAVS